MHDLYILPNSDSISSQVWVRKASLFCVYPALDGKVQQSASFSREPMSLAEEINLRWSPGLVIKI